MREVVWKVNFDITKKGSEDIVEGSEEVKRKRDLLEEKNIEGAVLREISVEGEKEEEDRPIKTCNT